MKPDGRGRPMEESGGRKLVQNCIGHLKGTLKPDGGRNRALYPVITVFFGQQSAEHFPTIRDTLEINWKTDAQYLKYLNIVKTDHGFVSSNLVTGEKDEENPSAFVEKAVVEMLGEELAFEKKSRTRFEYILLGEDEDAKEYYDFMLNTKLDRRYNMFKTLFIMLDERDSDKRQKIHELLGYITENRTRTKQDLGTVYLLSNYLKSGFVLRDDYQLSQNYRLVADLILMGGNQGEDDNSGVISTVENYDTIKTAAYAVKEKPVRSITIISLQKMMRNLWEESEKAYNQTAGDATQSSEKIQEKLGIQRGKIRCLEEIFKEIAPSIFPSSQEIQYLAFLNEQEYKNVYKEKRVSSQKLNQATGGNWNLFFAENYKNKIENLLSDERFISECLGKIEKTWRSALSYGDALYGLEDGKVRNALEDLTLASTVAAGNSVEEGIHFWAVEEARKLFYSHMIQLLSELLSDIHRDAKKFKDSYTNLEEEVNKEPIDNKEENIRSYYDHLAESFIRNNGNETSAEIFNLNNNSDDIIQSLENAFKKLIKNAPIYAMTFDEELQTRLSAMNDVNKVLAIQRVLEVDIETMVRLHALDTSYEDNILGIYYLMKKGEAYADELKKGGGHFTIFHLNRTDCIEKIAIYDLDSPGRYCDLTRMVGEV